MLSKSSVSVSRSGDRRERLQSMFLRPAAALFAAFLLMPPAAPAAEPEPPAAPAPAAPAAPAAQPLHVEGFRSAHWGMAEAQVRAAIAKDFKVTPDKIKSEENLAERTQVLSVLVPDLLEGAGPARASYIFGYST